MRSSPRLMRSLALAGCAALACSCASREPQLTAYPPSADLKVEAKPVLAPEALTSDNALAEYDAAVEAWGERGWAAVARICRWAVTNGAQLPFKCPPPDT
ncbi:hypothetical protein [Phenylobacterium sp.]|uniref:hypothetical protein n=1 Tax=Phenylobacterium sp. TaxID=1871053 RepID=UPI0035B357AE